MAIEVHITPNNDIVEHIPQRSCECMPYFGMDNGIINHSLLIHNAADARPQFVDVWVSPIAPNKGWTIINRLI